MEKITTFIAYWLAVGLAMAIADTLHARKRT
jgi:hypothetical protein